MMKPWSIKIDCTTLGDGLMRHFDRQHVHARCRGVDCKIIENYIDEMARRIHMSSRSIVSRHETKKHRSTHADPVAACAQ
eukprot:12884591-Prorocentrum_lima.AAC.1